MSAPAPSTSGRRVGLRAVAKAAGVCLRTASLALQNSPMISAVTARRVRKHAERLGYIPDADISRLMGRLRNSRSAPPRVAIALVDAHLRSDHTAHSYDLGLRRGILAKAGALGFGVAELRLADYGGDIARVLRAATEREITGLLLLPADHPVTFPRLAAWKSFSVVTTTTTVRAPRFHQVVPDQFSNMTILLETLHRRGHRRIGAILGEKLERRTAHYYSAALAWHGHRERSLLLPDAASPATNIRLVTAWFRRHRPDAILLEQNAVPFAALLGQTAAKCALAAPELVSLSAHAARDLAYLDQMPELIGASAASILVGMMHQRETGIPTDPRVTKIDGVFHAGERERGTLTVDPAATARDTRPATP